MTDIDKREAIYKSLGWVKTHSQNPDFEHCWRNGDQYSFSIPDYLNDLNAVYEAEKVLDCNTEHQTYSDALLEATIAPGCGYSNFPIVHANARQRTEALIKVLNSRTFRHMEPDEVKEMVAELLSAHRAYAVGDDKEANRFVNAQRDLIAYIKRLEDSLAKCREASEAQIWE